MTYIMFYKGKGDWTDWLIRVFTRSKYSHCEVLSQGDMYGVSSPLMKVSKAENKHYNPKDWDRIAVDIKKNKILYFFKRTKDMKYDWIAIILSQIFPFRLHSKKKYICSEWVAELLEWNKPHRYSPQDVYERLKDIR